MRSEQTRTYDRNNCIVFLKTKEAFGGLSNMAGGFPLRVNGIRIFTSEALYQACRFPHLPDVQRIVLGEPSPMTSKMKSKPYRKDSRPDWDQVRVRVMRWCLRVKLVQNWKAFGELLLATGDKPIVEESRKDDFWGANPVDEHTLVGMNVLGRLLMELREEFKSDQRDMLLRVVPLPIPDFMLMGQPIPVIEALAQDSKRLAPSTDASIKSVGQPSLFDQPALFDAKTVAVPMHEVNESLPQIYMNSRVAITDLKPYSEYKDSGSRWLAKVPAHWGIHNLRTRIRSRNERNRADLPLLSVAREKGVFVRSLTDANENHNVIPEDLSNYKVARAGNLVINKMKAWQGSMGVAPCDGIVSPAYFVFDFNIANSAFGQTLLRSKPYVAHFGQASDGVRVGQWDLTISGMRQIPVLVPPSEEQAAIVRYLNHATHRLDKAIRAKRKTIALLNEQKQAIIQRAVTRGLNPDALLKDSGIPWLGNIPQHWEQQALWTLSKLRAERNPSNLPLLSVFLNRGVIRYEDGGGQVHAPSLDLSNYQVVRVGDFVLNNQQAWRGSVGVSSHDGIISPAYIVLQLSTRLDSRYANYLMRSRAMVDQFVTASKGVGDIQRSVFWPFLRMVQVPLPMLEEQICIVQHLETVTAGLSTSISRFEREIDLLREYRTRLIADVVTGKLDVREVAAKLPEKPAPDVVERVAGMSDETESTDEEATV